MRVEHVAGIEPASSAWKAEVMAIIRHVHIKVQVDFTESYSNLQVVYAFTFLNISFIVRATLAYSALLIFEGIE